MNIFRIIGKSFLDTLETIGEIVVFCLDILAKTFSRPFYGTLFLSQCINIGYYSLPVVGMTTLFAGMVLALQSYTGVSPEIALATIPNLIVLAITQELAPVLTGLMVAGRIGASIAAEIGTMRVTEQIDALTTLATNPKRYLIVPRVLAGTLTLPLLVLVGDTIGILGGYVVGVYKLDLPANTYMIHTIASLKTMGIVSGLVKATVFGFITTMVGCYQGYFSNGGAQGVGRATTNAVVGASILILITNYLITELFVQWIT